MRAQDRHLARRQSFLGCMRLHLDASTAAEAFSLGSTTGPFTVEALESAGGNTGNADNYLAPPNHFQPAVHPWMETGNLRRKGRKPLEQSAVRDSSTISDTSLLLAARCRRRFGARWLGANRRILPAQLFIEKLSAVLLSHPRGALHTPLKTGSGNCGKCGNCRWGREGLFPTVPLLPPSPCVC
jgi:hypothetical protein